MTIMMEESCKHIKHTTEKVEKKDIVTSANEANLKCTILFQLTEYEVVRNR